jgi:hypothetical protein
MVHGYHRRKVRAWAKSRIQWFSGDVLTRAARNKTAVIAAVLLVVSLLLFGALVQRLVVMLAFIALGTASMMYNRWVKVSLGIELIMLGIVVTGMLYGPLEAIITGFIALFLAETLTSRFTYSTFISFIGIFAVAMAIPLMGDTGIKWVGIWMTLLYDAIIVPGYIVMGSSIARSALFAGSHILFNWWIFAFIAPRIMQVLT